MIAKKVYLLFCLLVVAGTAWAKPNFVIILTDDQGYGDLGCFGGTHIQTPRIDQMAAEGAKLTSFYMAGAVCTPSRAGLMTGSYPQRVGMANRVLLAVDSVGLNPTELTIAEVLKSAGYKTGMVGKWHLGDQLQSMPIQQGFDEFFGIPYSHDITPFHGNKKYKFPPLPLLEGETVIELAPDADYLTKRITGRAVRFIEENKDFPFFLYISHPAPHRPISVSPPFRQDLSESLRAKLALEKSNNTIEAKARDAMYSCAISEVDWSVGQILDALKEQGVDENTLVIFTSDNGPKLGNSGPLKGGKGSTFEGGMRVPTVIRWPGRIPAGVDRDELMTAMDLLPTFAKLAGADVPIDRVIDGKDIWPVLAENHESPHEAFFYHSKNQLKAVRSGQWKLHLAFRVKEAGLGKGKGKGTVAPALFNLDEDLGERKDVSKSHPEVVARLLELAEVFEQELAHNNRQAAFVDNPEPLTIRK
ncbi:sulfatase [Coraliomargarita algicola]|uniref:Sulfatase n=1 Tax=Coraliomargarita algicola TaxID=3092156 RepID=A0ABZ0RIC0_9BACT|nr:sulfatase [Coraliomargarita sp. J2-16]WPJ95951.1 sulfatase [Coraliomargarita sp. J2-16]